MNRSNQRELQQ